MLILMQILLIQLIILHCRICQSCKSFLEVFLISYKNKKLTICGRSPIEYIEVPKSIPKNAQQYYSDALLAYQSGQHLAGNFMLRVLIE